MTRVEFIKADGMYTGFSAKGHSGYAEAGEDIVCSAVSALTQTTVLGIVKTIGAQAEYSIDDSGFLSCTVRETDEKKSAMASLLIEVMYEGLCNIEGNYGKYLSISEREVTNNV